MTRPWYETAFNADYMNRYPHRDRDEAAAAVRTLMARTALPKGARAFDLCCGAGRHAFALHAAGLDVTGLDLSLDLLRTAREGFRSEHGCFTPESDPRQCPALVRGDMRRLPFAAESFDLVAHFFTAFGYFESDEENLAVFEGVARVLRPRGWYLLDFFCADAVRRNVGTETSTVEAGTRRQITRQVVGTPPRIEKIVVSTHVDGTTERTVESVRLFTPEELRVGLGERGFSIVEEWGDYEGAPFGASESGRYIALCRKAERG